MAERHIFGKQIQRNDTYANWYNKNPILDKGEIGIESNTRKFKIGDGVTKWNDLEYAGDFADYIRDINTESGFQLWIGTQDEYTSIPESSKTQNTIYIIK